jgi:hypothetical protein
MSFNKNILKLKTACILPILLPILCAAQDSDRHVQKIYLNGYIKALPSWNLPGNFERMSQTNIFHNRININIKASNHFQSGISFRNRLIWGDDVKQNPGYSSLIRNTQELLNLSAIWVQDPSLILYTNTERLWVEYRKSKWNLRIGRQRINWSMTGTWNPCDLFNVYNFLDVDYEERPGTDAIKFSYQTGEMSSLEFAFAPGKSANKAITAGRYTFHKNQTDFQLLAGLYKRRISFGGAWAGRLGETGWKGELQYFMKRGTEKPQLNMTTEFDHVFKKGWYLNGGMLYNANGISKRISKMDTLRFEFTPLQLMPTKFNFIFSSSKEINPIFSFTSSILYSPNSNLLILLPGLRLNMGSNLDADFIWQSFFASTERFKAMNHRGFIRIRWSY